MITGGFLDVFWALLQEGRGVGPVIVLIFLVAVVEVLPFCCSALRLYCARVCRCCSAERPPSQTRDKWRQ